MSAFARLKAVFDTNWTTILVGWRGLGVFSPWPDRSDDFVPLISFSDLRAYAEDRLDSSNSIGETDVITKLLSLELRTESRETITDLLMCLSNFDGGDTAFELRKWRLSLLKELLDSLPNDALNGLIALSEFWQSFGFPPDSPHVVQGRGNNITPVEYYQDENLKRLIDCHRAWVREEEANLKKSDGQRRGPGRQGGLR